MKVPQGVLSAVAYFQEPLSVVVGDQVGLVCSFYVLTLRRVFNSPESVLRRLIGARLYAAAHKLALYGRRVKLRGKVYTGVSVGHDLERIYSRIVHNATAGGLWEVDTFFTGSKLDAPIAAQHG